MKIEISDVKEFIKILDAISPMVRDEFFIVFTPNKFSVNLVNAYRTGMTSLNLDSKYFEGYEVEEEYIIPLLYKEFVKQLNMYKTFKKVRMEYDQENNRIKFYASHQKKRKRSHMQTINPTDEYQEPQDIKVTFTTMFSINSAGFDKALKECKMFDEEQVDFKITDTEFVIKSEADTKSGGTETAWSLVEDVKALMSENLEIAFNTEMLTDITSQVKKVADDIMLSMGDYIPLKISLTFKFGSLIYYLVPNDPRGE